MRCGDQSRAHLFRGEPDTRKRTHTTKPEPSFAGRSVGTSGSETHRESGDGGRRRKPEAQIAMYLREIRTPSFPSCALIRNASPSSDCQCLHRTTTKVPRPHPTSPQLLLAFLLDQWHSCTPCALVLASIKCVRATCVKEACAHDMMLLYSVLVEQAIASHCRQTGAPACTPFRRPTVLAKTSAKPPRVGSRAPHLRSLPNEQAPREAASR